MVIMNIVKSLSASSHIRNLYFYRTLKGVEVDLLLESGGKIDAYEIKWTQTPDKSMVSSLQALSEDHQVETMGILSPVASPFPVARGISAIPWSSELF